MGTQTITVRDVKEETLLRLDEKAQLLGVDREQFIRELLEREAKRPSTGLHAGMSFSQDSCSYSGTG